MSQCSVTNCDNEAEYTFNISWANLNHITINLCETHVKEALLIDLLEIEESAKNSKSYLKERVNKQYAYLQQIELMVKQARDLGVENGGQL